MSDERCLRVQSSKHFNCLRIIQHLQMAAVVVGSLVGQKAVCNDGSTMSYLSVLSLLFLIPRLIPLVWVDKTQGSTHLLSSKFAGPPTFKHPEILNL